MEASSSSTFVRFDDPAVPLPLLGEINGGMDGRADLIEDREVDFLSSILDIDDPFSNFGRNAQFALPVNKVLDFHKRLQPTGVSTASKSVPGA